MIFRKVSLSSFALHAGGPLSPLRIIPVTALLAAAACSRPIAPTTYRCPGGEEIVVGVGPRYAELHLPPDRTVRLYPVRAASGVRYSDGRYAVHMKGGEALLERSGTVLLSSCRVAGATPAPDSAANPARARQIVDSIDRVTAELQPQTRQIQVEARGAPPRVLSLWADSGRAIKLAVSEPGEPGATNGLTGYYFIDGRLEVVRGPVSQYLFRDTTLILWTTDSTQHVAEMPLRDMVARQNFVLGEVRQYLAMFGIEQ
ncbi:MAG: MliC family protein [Gemmatimonadales bacterium]